MGLALNPGSRRSHRRRNAIYSARRALVVLTPPHFGEGLPCLGKWPPLIAFNDPAILQPFSSFFYNSFATIAQFDCKALFLHFELVMCATCASRCVAISPQAQAHAIYSSMPPLLLAYAI